MGRFWFLYCIFLSFLIIHFSSVTLFAVDNLNFLGETPTSGAGSTEADHAVSTNDPSSDRTPGDGKGAGHGQYMIEKIRDDEGNVIKENFWVEDRLLQTLAPDSVDENKIDFIVDDSDSVKVVRYVDKRNNLVMVNGFVTDIPPEANIINTFKNEDGSVIVWQDSSGGYHKTEVPGLSTLPMTPSQNPQQLDSEDLTEDEMVANGFKDDQSASSDTSSSDSSLDDGNNTPDINDSVDDGSSPSSSDSSSTSSSDSSTATGSDSSSSGSSSGDSDEEPIDVPPIDLPGNKYGVDPVMSDADVEAIIKAEIAAAKAAYKGDGLSLNDWGIAQGSNSTTQITHSGKVDGFATPIHYWLSQASARGKVDSAAGSKRSGLEKERKSKIDKIKKDRKDKAAQKPKPPKNTSSSTSSTSSVPVKTPTPPRTPVKSPSSSSSTSSLDTHGAASSANQRNDSNEEFE